MRTFFEKVADGWPRRRRVRGRRVAGIGVTAALVAGSLGYGAAAANAADEKANPPTIGARTTIRTIRVGDVRMVQVCTFPNNATTGAVYARFEQVGGHDHFGCPRTGVNEVEYPLVGVLRYTDFDNGSLIWNPSGAFTVVVDNPVRDKWAALGGLSSSLGLPMTDTFPIAGYVGVGQHFISGGSIYSSPATGPHVVPSGRIRDRWAALSWEAGWLGFPVDDGVRTADKRATIQRFQGGVIIDGGLGAGTTFRTGTGVRALPKRYSDPWLASGQPDPALGLPLSETLDYEPPGPDGQVIMPSPSKVRRYVRFENGVLHGVGREPVAPVPGLRLDQAALKPMIKDAIASKAKGIADELRVKGLPRLAGDPAPYSVDGQGTIRSRVLHVATPMGAKVALWDPTFTLDLDLEFVVSDAHKLQVVIRRIDVLDVQVPEGTTIIGTTPDVLECAATILITLEECKSIKPPTPASVRTRLRRAIGPLQGTTIDVPAPELAMLDFLSIVTNPDGTLSLFLPPAQ